MASRVREPKSGAVELIGVAQLQLDRDNPRLPEQMLGKSEEELLRFALEEMLLEELALSFLENGYFSSEPMSVLRPQKKGGPYIVLEGNRRLAALRFLRRDRVPNNLELELDREPTREQLKRLDKVSCHVVSDRAEVDAMIGFRHIGGLRKWESEAKARFIYKRVQALVSKDIPDPFKELGRRIGSNAQGVRNHYIALAIAHWAREECSDKLRPRISQLTRSGRFGVWQRALNSGEIRAFIGFKGGTSYIEVTNSLAGLKKTKLFEVIMDLTVANGENRPLVRDSRYLTDYGRILSDPGAKKLLRETRDIDVARMLVDTAELPIRLGKLDQQIQALIAEIARRDRIPSDSAAIAHSIVKSSRHLEVVIKSIIDGGE